MSKFIPQEEWDRRAAKVDLQWLEEVQQNHAKTLIRCLTCDHEWKVIPSNVHKGQGCPACAGNQRLDHSIWEERAAAANLELLEEVPTNQSRIKVRCRECDFEWQTKGAYISQGRGCPICAGQASADSHKLSQAVWDERAKAVHVEFLEPVKTANTRAKLRCLDCGREYMTRPGHITQGKGCRICSAKRSWDAETNNKRQRITPEAWDERAENAGVKWLQPMTTPQKRTAAECLECGHQYMPWPVHITKGHGCPECADHGFDPLAPAHIYLLDRDDGVAQIGITKDMKTRMYKHGLNGYTLIAKWDFDTGLQAREIEQAIIKQWREEDDLLPAAVEGEDGWTETVHTDSMPIAEIARRVNALVAGQKLAP